MRPLVICDYATDPFLNFAIYEDSFFIIVLGITLTVCSSKSGRKFDRKHSGKIEQFFFTETVYSTTKSLFFDSV